MTWGRYDDGFTDQPVWEGVAYESRWHYFALVQFCCRTRRYDGHVRAADARRCSDVPDPAAALADLTAAGLIVPTAVGYRLPRIAAHVPPPSLRDENRKPAQNERQRRSRTARKPTEDPSHDMSRVTRPVTPGRDGTGQDGTGRALEADHLRSGNGAVADADKWSQ